MDAKLKAKEFIKKFSTKKDAITSVDEIMKIERLFITKRDASLAGYCQTSSVEYWQNVKECIK